MGYYNCAIAFAPDTALGIIIEADREIAGRGYISTIQVHSGRVVVITRSHPA